MGEVYFTFADTVCGLTVDEISAVVTRAGRSVMLGCMINMSDRIRAEITWMKDNVTIVDDGGTKYSIIHNETKSQLNITEVCEYSQRTHLTGFVVLSLHNLGLFSWPNSIYYCDVSLTNCTFIKLELRVQGTHFYGDAGEFDGRRGINLGIWSQWLYHGTDD